MLTNNILKAAIAGIAVLFLGDALQAQTEIIVLPRPNYGLANVSYGLQWQVLGAPPEYTAETSIPQPRDCTGTASASNGAVSGMISCNPNSFANAGSSTEYGMGVYADVVPESHVRVKFQASVSINWAGVANIQSGFSFTAPSGESQGTGLSRQPTLEGSSTTIGPWSAAVIPPATSGYESGGKMYYQIGSFYLSGRGELWSPNTNAGYSTEITGIEAHYIGKFLSIAGGDVQTGLVTKELPGSLSVQVSDGETGELASGIPITFSVIEPANNARFSNGQTSITTNTAAGLAAVKFTLGTTTGTYKVKATCQAEVCLSGAREVIFTEAGVGNELICVDCAFSGRPGKELANPFAMQVVDRATGRPVAEPTAVTYEVISFIDTNTYTYPGPNGASLNPTDTTTDFYGFSLSRLKLGPKKGIYIVRARCESCLSGQEQIARGTANTYDITAQLEENSAGDPDPGPPSGDCPSGCCPRTPVLRIAQVIKPNDAVSFTSDNAENLIGLRASIQPACLGAIGITWQVADTPDDYIESINTSNPIPPPNPGGASSFKVLNANLPLAPSGRALPLAYNLTASFTYKGRTYSSRANVRQDEIDKCRQEYFDVSLPTEDLSVVPYLSRYTRNEFTIGVDGAIDPDYVRFIDCYAHIYPSRAQEVENLRTNPNITFQIDVKSGYRSPRKNRLQDPKGVWNSEHQFGGGVDIVPKYMTDLNRARKFKALWENTSCPKILETGAAVVMAVCKTGENTPRYMEELGYNESNVFGLANCLHLGD